VAADLKFDHWKKWNDALFPQTFESGYADHHKSFWAHVWDIEYGVRPRAYVAIWARGGGKTTSAEVATIQIGARGLRHYAWYVQETQDQADKRIGTIVAKLESVSMSMHYPMMTGPKVGKLGRPTGWRREFLQTRSGYTIEAIGLDKAARSSKIEDRRPDLCIIDDIDGKHDSPKVIAKKVQTLTETLLPALANDAVVIFIQNVIHSDSVAAQLVDNRADFLLDRIVDGPHPALTDFEYEQYTDDESGATRYRVTAGKPVWAGQGVDICQDMVTTLGLTSFKSECQHDVDLVLGGIWDHYDFAYVDRADLPDIVRGAVWVDPAVSSTDNSDAMGIQADALGSNDVLYRMYSWEGVTSPEAAISRAIRKCYELRFTTVGIETDQGGDTWKTVAKKVRDDLVSSKAIPKDYPISFVYKKAGSGYGSKVERNLQMLASYETGNIVHVRGTSDVLDRALKRFPKKKPFDLADAAWWSWKDLKGGGGWVRGME